MTGVPATATSTKVTDVRWRVPLSDLAVDEELIAAVAEATASGWWSMGPRVESFERRFAERCGVRHALAVSSGTAALHLALLACGCGPGDEVVLPSLTFVAAANAVVHTGATPVFCDVVGLDDLNPDPESVRRLLGPRTKALVASHYGGFPCDLDALTALASAHGIALVEDAAHAPGACWRGRPCGSVGTVGCFSFFANKNLPTGEGGMLVTDDDDLAERVRLLRSHGMTALTWDRHRGHAGGYDVLLPGLNYRLDEIRAAIGLVQLSRLDEANAARGRLWARYRDALGEIGVVTVPFREQRAHVAPAYHLAVVLLPLGVDRDRVRSRLAAAGVQTSVHYPPIHRFTAYRAAAARADVARTEALEGRVLTLPLYPHLEEEAVELVAESLVEALGSR